MAERTRPRPIVLCVLDGVGIGAESQGNAVALARTPELDALRARGTSARLAASGPSVGLAEGQASHGALGHRVLGTGRAGEPVRAAVDQAIARSRFGTNEVIDQCFRIAQYDECRLHVFGLLSEAAVHCSPDHLYALIELADFHQVPVVVHAILDGRDSPPRSAMGQLDRLEQFLEGRGVIGTVAGRGYAMAPEGRWDLVHRAFHAVVRDPVLGPEAPCEETAFDALRTAYQQGLSDDQVVPARIGDYRGIAGEFMSDFSAAAPVWEWTGEEVGLALHYRADGLRQLSALLTRAGLPPEIAADLLMDRDKPVLAFREHCFAALAEHDPQAGLPVAFAPAEVADSVGALLEQAELKQLRCGETAKAAHVTHFFNGGRHAAFSGEQRILVPSPATVDSYDEKPEMSMPIVARRAAEAAASGEFDFILVNLAGPDEVAHTAELEATGKAVQAADAAVGQIAQAVQDAGGALLVTGDHGGCEQMQDPTGKPDPTHSTNPVELIYACGSDPAARLAEAGSLCDVAPTVLALLGIDKPPAMTGESLLRPSGRVP